MLQNTRDLYGKEISATDGHVGTLEDFFFDEKCWLVRYIMADTGEWLSDRTVLLSADFLGEIDTNRNTLDIKLTRKQIENSPAIDSGIPVSRQYEVEYYRYYGLPVYWTSSPIPNHDTVEGGETGSDEEIAMRRWRRHSADQYLRSARALEGFHIEGLDGLAGKVSGLFLDDRSWSIPALVVDAGHWYAGKQILISADNIDRINFGDSTVFVNLHRSDIHNTHEADVARVSVSDHGRNLFHD
jgi:hypothetical protein